MTVTTSFNLIDDAWLPVRYADGREDQVGLRVALGEAPRIRDLAITFPLEYVATLRMVVTVLQCACNGPRSTREKARWFDAHHELRPAFGEYFDTWSERFELFHPTRPFMQAPIGSDVSATTIAALRPDWSSGNNATLFDHHVDDRPDLVSSGEAARALLTTLLFQPGGGVSKPFNRTDSPATKALQVLVEGRDLWETLVANAPNLSDPGKRPVWEQPGHDGERPDRAGTTPAGWLDRASWRSRAVRLVPDQRGGVSQVRVHQHLKISDVPPFDPYAPVRHPKGKPPVVVRASAAKALWRDADALIEGLRPADDHPTVVAEALRAFGQRDEAWLPGIRVIGQVVNQAKVGDVREGRMPMSRALLEDELHLEVVGGMIEAAETGAKALRGAIATATAEMGGAIDGWGRARRWETDYWAVLATPFHAQLATIAMIDDPVQLRDGALVPWKGTVGSTARKTYGRFSGDGAAGRAPRAIGKGRATLERQLMTLHPREERG